MIRVLIVDDSGFIRKMLARMLDAEPDIRVVGQGTNGNDAVKLARSLRPDVMTLDVEMPGADGLSALKALSNTPPGAHKPAVLMCSTLTSSGSRTAVEALRLGAADVIAKDTAGDNARAFADELLAKVRAIGGRRTAPPPAGRPGATGVRPPPARLPRTPPDLRMLVVGSSTGGPPVVERIVRALPASPSFAITIAQHMPAMFTRSLAERLNELSAVPVGMAEPGAPVEPGRVYICEGGRDTMIEGPASAPRFAEAASGAAVFCHPSVDALVGSAAKVFGARAAAVIITGMGGDGSRGAAELRRAGGTVLAQSEQSCVVYGMPRAVIEAGSAHAATDPEGLAAAVASMAARTPTAQPVRRSA